jgi:hypothetical protein
MQKSIVEMINSIFYVINKKYTINIHSNACLTIQQPLCTLLIDTWSRGRGRQGHLWRLWCSEVRNGLGETLFTSEVRHGLGRGLAPLQVCLHAGLPLRSARCILPWPPGQFGLQIPLQSVGGTLPLADLPCDLGLEGMALRGRLGPSSLFARATQAYSSCLALATGHRSPSRCARRPARRRSPSLQSPSQWHA